MAKIAMMKDPIRRSIVLSGEDYRKIKAYCNANSIPFGLFARTCLLNGFRRALHHNELLEAQMISKPDTEKASNEDS